jgi:hypothetical protein
MQPESGQVHVRNIARSIETRENVTKLFRVFADHAARVGIFVEAFEAFYGETT